MKFYLGTPREAWLEYDTQIPFFISYRILRRKKNFKKVKMNWCLDSGGFTELSLYSKWTIDRDKYLDDCFTYYEEMGNVDFFCPQDWMCKPHILKNTQKTIQEHQQLTIDSYLYLKSSGLPFIPILQGWSIDDYLQHMRMYETVGIDLTKESTVGVGSICRRQGTEEINNLIKILSKHINIHAFGAKIKGLTMFKDFIKSSDSMAWGTRARYSKDKFFEDCKHKRCTCCYKYAQQWYWKIQELINEKNTDSL